MPCTSFDEQSLETSGLVSSCKAGGPPMASRPISSRAFSTTLGRSARTRSSRPNPVSGLLAPTLDDAKAKGRLHEIATMWLDRGSDSEATRQRLNERGVDGAVMAGRPRRASVVGVKCNQPMGRRWPVERTNSWRSNLGQLRRNTDCNTSRKPADRLAQFALAVVFLLTAKLIDSGSRWSPASTPIR